MVDYSYNGSFRAVTPHLQGRLQPKEPLIFKYCWPHFTHRGAKGYQCFSIESLQKKNSDNVDGFRENSPDKRHIKKILKNSFEKDFPFPKS